MCFLTENPYLRGGRTSGANMFHQYRMGAQLWRTIIGSDLALPLVF